MKTLSPAHTEKKVKVKIHSTEEKEKPVRRPKVSKEEREKEGRYFGFIILLVTVIAAVVISLFKTQ